MDNTGNASPKFLHNSEQAAHALGAEAYAPHKQTALTSLVDSVTSRFFTRGETLDEANQYIAQGLKTACLFARGGVAVAGAMVFSGLDQVNPQDDLRTRMLDGALGATKGALTKGVFRVVGDSPVNIGVKAFALGVSSRGLDTLLSRQTYLGETGDYDLLSGIKTTFATTFDRRAAGTDLVMAGAASALIGGGNLVLNGAIGRSPFLMNTLTGTAFGLVSGASNEVLRQENSGHGQNLQIDWKQVAFRGAVQAGVDTAAAMLSAGQHNAHAAKKSERTSDTTILNGAGTERVSMVALAVSDGLKLSEVTKPAVATVVSDGSKLSEVAKPAAVTVVSDGSKLSELEKPPVVTEMFTPFKRLSDEPVLSPRPGKFDSAGAFNPAAVKMEDGRTVLLYRAQDHRGVSTVGYAESTDGINFTRLDEPVLAPRWPDEANGIEDPRVTKSLTHPGAWDMTATAYNTEAQLALYRSYDLKNWARVGMLLPAKEGAWNENWTKSGAIVPEKIDGKYWMYYMGDAPASMGGHDQMGIASSPDGLKWTDATDKPVLPRRPGMFDAKVVEPGPAPIITNDGILLLYNGGDEHLQYRIGWALFDKTDPTRVLARSDQSIYEPQMSWEKKGGSDTVRQAPNVVFAEGLVKDGNRFLVYYGGADSYVGVAETRIQPVIGRVSDPATH